MTDNEPRRFQWTRAIGALLVVPGIFLLAPSAVADDHVNCAGEISCDAGDACNVTATQGTDISIAEYTGSWQGNSNTEGGSAVVEHATVGEERWIFTTCSPVNLKIDDTGSSSSAKVDDCLRLAGCGAKAFHQVTLDGESDTKIASCSAAFNEDCLPDYVPLPAIVEKTIHIVLPNTPVNAQNCGHAEVFYWDGDGNKIIVLNPDFGTVLDVTECSPTVYYVGPLPPL